MPHPFHCARVANHVSLSYGHTHIAVYILKLRILRLELFIMYYSLWALQTIQKRSARKQQQWQKRFLRTTTIQSVRWQRRAIKARVANYKINANKFICISSAKCD